MRRRTRSGFTLLEAVICLGLFMLLVAGLSVLLWHAGAESSRLLDRQDATENARAALDILVNNIQMAETVTLLTIGDEGRLNRMYLRQIAPSGAPECYRILLQTAAGPTGPFHLAVGTTTANTAATRLTNVRLRLANEMLHIEVAARTATGEDITLFARVDVRYKAVRTTGMGCLLPGV